MNLTEIEEQIDNKIREFTDKLTPYAMDFPKLRSDIKKLFGEILQLKLATIPDETWDQFKQRSSLIELHDELLGDR